MSKEVVVMGDGLVGKAVYEQSVRMGLETFMTTRTERNLPNVKCDVVDLTDPEMVDKYFFDNPVSYVVVAAGMAHPPTADKDPSLAFLVNAQGPRNIGEAILKLPEHRRPKVVYMGSALQYQVRESGAIPEDNPTNIGGGAYVESKNLMDKYVKDMVGRGLDARIARLFNAVGPGQGMEYFIPSLADQVAKISLGIQEPSIMTRYVNHLRDFSHVKDSAMGIILTLKSSAGEIINISSGYGTKLEDIVIQMLKVAGVNAAWRVTDPQHPERPHINTSWGDNTKLRGYGFNSEYTIGDLCVDMYNYALKDNENSI